MRQFYMTANYSYKFIARMFLENCVFKKHFNNSEY